MGWREQEEIKIVLREINSWDLKLWDFAQGLMAYRLKLVGPAINHAVKAQLGLDEHRNSVSVAQVQQAHYAAVAAGKQKGASLASADVNEAKRQQQQQLVDQCRADETRQRAALGAHGIMSRSLGVFQPPGHKGPF